MSFFDAGYNFGPSDSGAGEGLPAIADGDVSALLPNKSLQDWQQEFGNTNGRKLFRISERLLRDNPSRRESYRLGRDERYHVLIALAETVT